MSARSEQELSDLFKWWKFHKDTITDPIKRSEFLETAFTNTFYVLAGLVEDMKNLENANRPDLRMGDTKRPQIMLPKGFEIDFKDLRNND